MFIKAYASGGAGNRGTKTGNARGNGYRTMSQYYRATGQSALGATRRTSGTLASIRPVTRGPVA